MRGFGTSWDCKTVDWNNSPILNETGIYIKMNTITFILHLWLYSLLFPASPLHLSLYVAAVSNYPASYL